MPEQRAARPRWSYFPFGGGSRGCIGESFAWMEATVALATIARRWRMQRVDGREISLHPTITLRPKREIPMLLRRREPVIDPPAALVKAGSLPSE